MQFCNVFIKFVPLRAASSSKLIKVSTMKRETSASPAAAKRPKSATTKSTPTSASSSKKEAAPVPDLEDCGFSANDLPEMRTVLLSWYDKNHRILPWRRNPHSRLSEQTIAKAAAEGCHPAPADLPIERFIYCVWICEIMSQQTQVSRAAEYFRKWIKKWPDVQSLAAASQEEVNEVWAGLGYYRRAKFLLDGAKWIVNENEGAFPRTAKELMKIPGVGAYTSNAIASIACGEQVAVVDGNVIRVMSRLRQLAGDPRSGAMTKLFADVAQQALDPERPGDFNQAVMELGATVCVPNTQPSCTHCPVNSWCEAYKAEKEGGSSAGVKVTDYPTKVEKAEKREEHVAAAVVRVVAPGSATSSAKEKKGGKYLLVKRPAEGLLAGLWEFPLQPVEADANEAVRRGVVDEYLIGLFGEDGISMKAKKNGSSESVGMMQLVERTSVGTAVHVFSHIRMTMHVEVITLEGVLQLPEDGQAGEGDAAEVQWLSEDELGAKGLSSGVKKVFKVYTTHRDKPKVTGKSITSFFKPVSGAAR